MSRPKFFIGRYPTRESLQHITGAQSKLRDIEKKTMVQDPHITYVGSKPIVKATLHLNPENLNMLIHPLPSTAFEPLTLGVKGLRSVQGRRLLPYLIIDLEDSEGIYESELRAIRGRIDNYLPIGPARRVTPHVSLARVGIESLSLKLVDQIENELPDSIQFKSIDYPRYTEENVGDVEDQDRLKPRMLSPVAKAPVPQGLIDSFRTATRNS